MSYLKYIDIIPDPGPHHGLPPPLSISFDKACNGPRGPRGEGAVRIAEIRDKDLFSSAYNKYERLPFAQQFKKAGSVGYRIPEIYRQFAEVLQIIADYEAMHSDLHLYKENILTMRQTILLPGESQISLGWHADGPFTSSTLDHIYVIADRKGPLIQTAPMDNAKKRLDALKPGEIDPALCFRAEPYTIYLMTNYCLHCSPVMDEHKLRTFLRMVYSGLSADALESLPLEKRQKLELG
jgi:hypothetical protein